MKRKQSSTLCVESLEVRETPATLDVVSGALTYTAGATVNNVVSLTISGSNYSISDTAETIALGAGAVAVGFTGGGSNNVVGPNAEVAALDFQLGDLDDSFQVNGLTDPLTVDGQAGTGDTIAIASAINPAGALALTAETISQSISGPVSGATTVSFTANTMLLNAAIGANGRVILQPQTAGRPISVGAEVSGSLSLTDLEVDRFTTPDVLQIGSPAAGLITLGGTLTVTNVSTLSLRSSTHIQQLFPATLAVANLAVAGDSIAITNGNAVGTLAVTGSQVLFGNGFDPLVIGSVDGLNGIIGGGDGISIRANVLDVQQTIQAGTSSVQLRPFSSALITLGAEVAGTLSLTDAELDRVTAGVLTIGGTGGNTPMTIEAPISQAGSGYSTLRLQADAGSISNSPAASISVTNLALSGFGGPGFSAPLSTEVINLSFDFISAGQTRIANTGPLTIADLGFGDSSVGSSASLEITATGLLSIAVPLRAGRGTLALNGAGVTQTAEITQPTSPPSVGAVTINGGAEPIVLTHAANDFNGAVTLLTSAAATIADANNLILAGQDVAEQLTISALGTVSQTGAFTGAGGLMFNGPGTLQLSKTNTFAGTTLVNSGVIAGAGSVSGPLQVGPGARLGSQLGLASFSSGSLSLSSGSVFSPISVFPDPLMKSIVVTGSVDLGGTTLTGSISFPQDSGLQFTLIDNDDTDAVAGTFAGLAEGALVLFGSQPFQITYSGGDGNDVVLATPSPLVVTVAPDGKSATFTDVDGDLVTVRTTLGAFDGSEFLGYEINASNAGQLQKLTLDADFTGVNIAITAKRTAAGGNGFVNVGAIDAAGVDLGAVIISGDLGRIVAGAVGGNVQAPAIRSLTVQSIGLLGGSTQQPGGSNFSVIQGAVLRLAVRSDLRGSMSIFGDADGLLGTATIGGSVVSSDGGGIFATAGIGSLKIGGDIRVVGGFPFDIRTNGAIGTLSVAGSIIGKPPFGSVGIAAFGQAIAPVTGSDFAIKNLIVGGTVEYLNVFAGDSGAGNADASIGVISVGGDWIASKVAAGMRAGPDGSIGTDDDLKFDNAGVRDNATIFSRIGSVSIKGQAFGTADTPADMFGIVAERIGKARVGGRAFTLTNGATPEGFFAAPTGRGSGAGNPAFDFAIRELGSTMPTIVLDLNFNLTADGRTATFTDVDGDLVTVKRSAGAFVAGDFIITPADSGGGSLDLLTVTSVAGGAPVNLSITAQSSGDGGNGLVNVGAINALGDLGAVFIAGELGSMDAGDSDPARPGVRNLTVRSLGTLSGHSGDHAIDTANGIGTVTVATSVRDMAINAIGAGTGRLGVVTIGGSLVGNSVIDADGNIGFVKIGGNMAGGRIVTDGRIGAIAIRGNLIGTGGTSISASASTAGPTTGLDLAIKSLTVIGTVENTRIEVGLGSNADASIGAINVGREWLVGSVLAGVAAGADNFIGTADDTKTPGAGIDVATRFSTIASINIRGQALGSAANADSFGFVAERIARAKIGSRLLVLNAGERDATDAFAIAPTAAGVGGLPFDVIVREITA